MEKLGPGDPQRIGAYRLLARLGSGGMGNVYLARSERGRTVAVKLVRQELAEQEEFRARFRQEVRAARQVGGYWTAPVLDADTEAGIPWVATGYVAGPSLQSVVGRDHGALPERSVRILAAGLAHALEDIHAAGLIHRDLKPSNVLVTIDGPRVIDFGIARALETVTDGGLTRTGALVGSPGFMAPEQVRGDRITPACDVFCLGSVLSYAATGTLPFGAANSGVHALMFRIAEEEPDLEGLPEGLYDIVRECLRKDPAARPTLAQILQRTGAEDTVFAGRSRDPWLPSALVAQLGRHAVQLLDAEDPEEPPAGTDGTEGAGAPGDTAVEGEPGGPADGGAPGRPCPPGSRPGCPPRHRPRPRSRRQPRPCTRWAPPTLPTAGPVPPSPPVPVGRRPRPDTRPPCPGRTRRPRRAPRPWTACRRRSRGRAPARSRPRPAPRRAPRPPGTASRSTTRSSPPAGTGSSPPPPGTATRRARRTGRTGRAGSGRVRTGRARTAVGRGPVPLPGRGSARPRPTGRTPCPGSAPAGSPSRRAATGVPPCSSSPSRWSSRSVRAARCTR
ncbi:serine/threonine-protein kinase [Streptomyces scabiei]|uniref:serine/threonine-protein kinase n=1 Tax=Streptomyces scabiei TaxID=1930 RepID=UPI0027E054B2|nr:serine/threonine-protein kinase [Streptomyces sp. LBUM 1481]